MKNIRSTLLTSLSLASLAFGLSGCSTVALDESGDKSAVYQLNEFRMVLNTTAPVAFAATQKAFREYDLFETKSELNTYDGELYARSRTDDKVFVSVSEMNSKQTLLRIRWSTTGDKKNSRALYDLIERNLR
ncbi:DUF3568 family protein [Rariglobus hedericola]|uniref:DUF3568 family protein n=1 Tax=Rariglobus hedericola TaxID=2597822 RepID=A0A556QS10_9BACT|nr:DUF3568 family protein [Rariglobus hedericola]TSJ79421.1 DUF3568 family protein [Rariglobus hedericola]